jgi:hypothetical protein
LGAGFVPVRKKGKLPGPTETASFEKEYGADHFEMQSDAIKKGNKVLVVDDIIATGGSAAAAGQLVQNVGGHLLGFIMILELDFLRGRDKLPAPCYTLLSTQSTSTTSEPSWEFTSRCQDELDSTSLRSCRITGSRQLAITEIIETSSHGEQRAHGYIRELSTEATERYQLVL